MARARLQRRVRLRGCDASKATRQEADRCHPIRVALQSASRACRCWQAGPVWPGLMSLRTWEHCLQAPPRTSTTFHQAKRKVPGFARVAPLQLLHNRLPPECPAQPPVPWIPQYPASRSLQSLCVESGSQQTQLGRGHHDDVCVHASAERQSLRYLPASRQFDLM